MYASSSLSLRKALRKFKAPERLSISEWAEKNFVLSSEFSSVSGRFNFNATPYMRQILDELGQARTRKLTWISSAQSGKTTAMMIIAAYYMAQEPSSIMLLEPNEALCQSVSTERFASVIRSNPKLRQILSQPDSKSNELIKIFEGGYLIFASAASYNSLISRPIRILIRDEVDSYIQDLKLKGNPMSLAADRTTTFSNRKIITCSTPGIEGLSNVYDEYNKSDMRVYFCPCPYCGEEQELKFSQLTWDAGSEGRGAKYKCEFCRELIPETKKKAMVSSGIWKATNDNPEEPFHIGFKQNQLISLFPNCSWEAIATRFISAKRRNDVADLKVFTTQVLAETWSDQHLNNTSQHELVERQEIYNAEVPAPVGLLVAGVDMQADRCEVTVLGMSANSQIYVIDHHIIHGDSSADPDGPSGQLYKELDSYLNRSWQHESGNSIFIKSAFVDVGDGQRTHVQRKFCFARIQRGIFACMGSRLSTDFAFSGKKILDTHSKMPIYYVGTVACKDDIFHRLRIKYSNQPGYIHFPKPMIGVSGKYQNINSEYFKQLTSEKLIEKREAGITRRIYVQKYKGQAARNEALDCFCYALSCYQKEIAGNTSLVEEAANYLNSNPVVEYKAPEAVQQPLQQHNIDNNHPALFDFFAAKQSMRRY